MNRGEALLLEVGAFSRRLVTRVGRASLFLGAVLRRSQMPFARPRLLLREIYTAGVLTLSIVVVSGGFVGLVLGLQGYDTLQRFGSETALGSVVALSLLRELGPVIAALLFASRAGSAMTAEIGLMKATEQLDAMEVMAVDPIARVIAPKFWGGVLVMPLLAAVFSAVGVLGGWFIGVVVIGVDEGTFWSQMQGAVSWEEDVAGGVIKSAVFGVVVTWIALYQGWSCRPTAEGVSQAITRTVVLGALAVLAADFVLTAFMFIGV
ncbi:MAG: lipid asymmetry maintenance ABC transporter permease subunit MlaE [Hydrogenophilus sp.]|nr:lipid asymmetry maintenance ABC transporter permease subunit MlaE [Hydrogenophilus sp.]